MNKLSQVRVKRKGQVTIPLKLGSKLGIEEGATLEVKETEGAIVLRPTPRLRGAKWLAKEGIGKSSVNSIGYGETGVADTRLLLTLEFPPNDETKENGRLEKEIARHLLAPSIILTEFIKIAGIRIGEDATRTRLRLL